MMHMQLGLSEALAHCSLQQHMPQPKWGRRGAAAAAQRYEHDGERARARGEQGERERGGGGAEVAAPRLRHDSRCTALRAPSNVSCVSAALRFPQRSIFALAPVSISALLQSQAGAALSCQRLSAQFVTDCSTRFQLMARDLQCTALKSTGSISASQEATCDGHVQDRTHVQHAT
eukprot:3080986-Pleurochrysis_carterae.AAC.4